MNVYHYNTLQDAYARLGDWYSALAILDATDTAKASLIGLSLGGLYAALIAAPPPPTPSASSSSGAA